MNLLIAKNPSPLPGDQSGVPSASIAPMARYLYRMTAIVTLGILFLNAITSTASGQETEVDRQRSAADLNVTDQLIADLSSSSYRKREVASEALVQQGPEAINELASRLIDESPEIQWRVKKVLAKIASSYDNETLFKAMAILKLRFNDVDAVSLKREWQNSKRKEAIAKLRSLGMKVVDDVRARGLVGWRNNVIEVAPGQVFLGGGVTPFPANQAEMGQPAKVAKPTVRPPTSEQLREQMAQILNGTLEENRKRVFEGVPAKPAVQTVYGEVYGMPTVQLSIDEGWSGTVKDLEAIKALVVRQVSFESVELDAELLKVMLSHSPDIVHFKDCRVPESERPLGMDRLQIRVLSISQATTKEAALLMQLLGPTSVNHLQLALDRSDVDFFAKTTEWAKSIQSLELAKMNLSKTAFDSLKEMPVLRTLMLSHCRFKIQDYQRFQSQRSDVRMDFLAVAFLGVSGARLGARELEITRVVEGSAASAAGVEVGDIVLAVGDQKVGDFEDLRLLIAQYDIGDTIEIEVSRDGEVVELSAKLKPNDQAQILR